jgi:hypothetical protein
LPGCRIAGLPDCRIAGLPDCRAAGLPETTRPLGLGEINKEPASVRLRRAHQGILYVECRIDHEILHVVGVLHQQRIDHQGTTRLETGSKITENCKLKLEEEPAF